MNFSTPNSPFFTDVHTHRKHKSGDSYFLRNGYDFLSSDVLESLGYNYSCGRHPWMIGQDFDIQASIKYLEAQLASPNFAAIGEIGLDKIKGNFKNQIAYIDEVWRWNTIHQKPIILHLVRSNYEIIPFLEKATFPIIWHGFNGNIEFVKQLVKWRGKLFVSFGKKIMLDHQNTAEQMRNLPLDMLFLETDNSNFNISEIYTRTASVLKLTVEDLAEQIRTNRKNVFGV